MDIAIRRTLTSLVWAGLLLTGPLFAQETRSSATGAPPGAEVIPIPAPDGVPGPGMIATVPAQAEEEPTVVGEEQPYIDSVFGGCAPGCETCTGGSGCPPRWYVESDLRVLNRGRPRPNPAPYTREQSQSQFFLDKPLMYNDSLKYGIAPGMVAKIGRYLGTDMQGRDRFLEFEYWGLNRWNTDMQVEGQQTTYTLRQGNATIPVFAGNLISLFATGVGGFNRADRHILQYESDLNSFELNLRFSPRSRFDRLVLYPNGRWRRECQPGVYCSYLAGIRYLRIGDQAAFRSRGDFFANGPTGTVFVGPVSGDYEIFTRNDLIGVQIGGAITYRECRWTADVHGKVGPYLNAAQSKSSIVSSSLGVDPFATTDRGEQVEANRDLCAVAGEFGFAGTYRFTPKLVGRASYDFMWIGGLAVAPEQFDFASARLTDNMTTNGAPFYHGLTVGLEYNW